MKKYTLYGCLHFPSLSLAGLLGCKQETPEGKAKAAAALGNEVTEVAGQAA